MTKTDKRRTNQKNAIREALFRLDNHPTASMVAEELSGDVHKASRATVFKAGSAGYSCSERMFVMIIRPNPIIICTACGAEGSGTALCRMISR